MSRMSEGGYFFMGCCYSSSLKLLMNYNRPFKASFFSHQLNHGSVEDDPSLYRESMVMQELIF